MDYQLIKSRRKTIAIQITDSGVVVRAPMRTSRRESDAFVKKHEDWIKKHLIQHEERRAQAACADKLSPAELKGLYERARELLPARARYFAGLLGESCGRVTIRCQHTRWGSCSTKRNLSFNCLLMLTPPEVIDSVVVHEVCHLREMNHSARFYELVLGLCPEYKRWDRWLKDNGRLLLARLPEI